MQEVKGLIDNLITFQESFLDAPNYFPRMTSYECHYLTQACAKCHKKGKILEEKASTALEICLKVNKFILKVVTDLNFPSTCEDDLPLPSLNSLAHVKDDHEKNNVDFLSLEKLDKNVEIFVVVLAKACAKINESIIFIQNILKESLEQKLDFKTNVEYLAFSKKMEFVKP